MRSLTALLQSAQQLLNRSPNSRVIIRDVFLRLSELASGAVATNYPDAAASGIPQCPIDFLITGGDAWRAWMKNSHLYLHVVDGTLTDAAQWEAGAVTDIVLNTTHRPSTEGNKVYYADPTAEKIYTRTLIAGAVGAEVSFSDVPDMEAKVALAAVASGCYFAELVEIGGADEFKYVQVSKTKGGGAGFGSKNSERYPAAGSTAGGAGEPWSNPTNAGADDNVFTDADLPAWTSESEELQLTSFGFSIPAKSDVLGVKVAVGKYATWGTAYRKLITVNWNAGAVATNYPVCVTLDTTVPIAASKMKADCADLAVIVDGAEVDRWIADPNNANTKVWFNLSFTAAAGSQHTIYFYYNSSDAKSTDDDYKPPFDLSASTNGSWDFLNFGGDSGDYSASYAKWSFTQTDAPVTKYNNNHGGGGDPWSEAGLGIASVVNTDSADGRREIANVCGITDMAYLNGEYWLSRPAAITCTLETLPAATAIALTNDSSWHNWSTTDNGLGGVGTAGYKITKDAQAGAQYTTFYAEMSRCTVALDGNNTPGIVVGGEGALSDTPVRDKAVRVVKTGADGSNKAATGTNWPQNSEAETAYGGAADMWGLTLTPAEVNHADFGVDLSVLVVEYDAAAYVDYVEVTVYYQPNVDMSPHAIVVDPDYTQASMSWFDAVTLGSKDVIVISQRAYGDPVVMFYEDGAWSDPHPILPADIVDNYTFLRISGMTVITDSDGDDVIWACGRIGRGGSSGLNSQEWDCVLRSKDGEHWTLDRYQYLCEDSKRSRLQVDGSYAFYPNGASIMYGKRTWLMGHDHSDLKWTITDDLAGWQLTQGGVSQPATGATAIADHDGDYKPYKSGGVRYGIWAGYWLWRYAGFNGYEVLLSTEGLDRTPGGYKAGDRKLQLVSRDIVMRQLIDWASDQDWQWLSQQKLYDDCDQIDHLYSVSGTQITVTSGDLVGQVEQEEMIITGANELVYETLNNEGVFIATKPAECRNYVASATFRYLTNTNGRNLALGGSPQYLGFGFGVIGSAHGVDPAFNVVAAYYDTKTDKLYLLQRTGDSGSNAWAQLAVSAGLAGSASENQRNRVELHRDGPNFTARILRFTQGSDATELAKVEYTWAVTDWTCDQEDDRGRVGVICNMDVTSGVGTEAIYITDVQAYDGDDPDKTLEWTLEDIAAKAGVMGFETAYSVDEGPFTGDDNPAAAVWLQDTDGVDLNQRDFDLTFTLPNQIQDGDSLIVIAKGNSKLGAAPTNGNLTAFSGCKITYLRSGAEWKVQFHQTTADAASATKANWVEIDEMTFNLSVDDTAGGKRVRVVGYDDFFAIYINGRWVRTFHLGPVFDHVDDGYDSTMKGAPGYIGVWRVGATNWEAMTVTQPELWTWTDGIIMDQRMNALAGMLRTIRDRRVYFLPRADGALKISQFSSRDTLQSLGDQIYEDADAPTDRVATHVRVVGEEISDYVDHAAAADWGITFALAQCPSLAEKEGYAEAQKIASDSISRALGRQMSHAARVDWEPEDKIPVAYAPCDGGPSVSDDYVVTAVVFSYRLGDLTSHAALREDR